MKLDVNVLRYLAKEDFRVLTAVEMGQKNHELVPIELVDSISGLKHGGAFKCAKLLLRHKLLHHETKSYDGYRLTPLGYDYLALRVLLQRGHITSVGRQIGVGKESDIFEVCNDAGEVLALKLHRLGRTSFRAVRSKRDYHGRRGRTSWLYLSRLAALKEFAFMKALGENGFPVPIAVDHNRHAVLMSLVSGTPLVQRRSLPSPATSYLTCMDLLARLARVGLVHCDFNEFNLMVDDEGNELTLIDFPQMVSVDHFNARSLFERDVDCIVRFFSRKLGYDAEQDPRLPYVRPAFEAVARTGGGDGEDALDVSLEASGFKRRQAADLDRFLDQQRQEQQEHEGQRGWSGHTDDDDDDDDNNDDDDGQEQQPGSGEGADVSAVGVSDGVQPACEQGIEQQADSCVSRHRTHLHANGHAHHASGSDTDVAAAAGASRMAECLANGVRVEDADVGPGLGMGQAEAGASAGSDTATGGGAATPGASTGQAEGVDPGNTAGCEGPGGSCSSAGSQDEDSASDGLDDDDGSSLMSEAQRQHQERAVQQRVQQQRQAVARRQACARASRNATKTKGRKKQSPFDGGW